MIKPTILENDRVRLSPLTLDNYENLQPVAAEHKLVQYSPSDIESPAALKTYVEIALDQQKQRFSLPFIIYDKQARAFAGCTRYMNIDHKSYTIVDVVVIPQTEGGVTKFMDQTLTFATSAVSDSGSTTRSVLGWAHTTSPAATTTATTASSPWFYNVQDEEGNIIRTVHQMQLTNQAGIETYIAAEIAGWWA